MTAVTPPTNLGPVEQAVTSPSIVQMFQQSGIKAGLAAAGSAAAMMAVMGTPAAPLAPIAGKMAGAVVLGLFGLGGTLFGVISHKLGHWGSTSVAKSVAAGKPPGVWATLWSRIF